MDGQMYGWIGNDSKNSIDKRGSGTDTANYFKYYLRKKGCKNPEKVGARNLLIKNNKYYYVLSIGIDHTQWAPSAFIENSYPLCLILTMDTGKNHCKVWVIDLTEDMVSNNIKEEELVIDVITLKKRQGTSAGDYYTLTIKQVEKYFDGREKKESEYNGVVVNVRNGTEDNAMSIKELIDKIVE